MSDGWTSGGIGVGRVWGGGLQSAGLCALDLRLIVHAHTHSLLTVLTLQSFFPLPLSSLSFLSSLPSWCRHSVKENSASTAAAREHCELRLIQEIHTHTMTTEDLLWCCSILRTIPLLFFFLFPPSPLVFRLNAGTKKPEQSVQTGFISHICNVS